MDDAAAFSKMIEALKPWHAEVVVVGGWAHRLHRLHGGVRPLTYQPLQTRDADIAFGSAQSLKGDIGAALRSAGFHQDMTGEQVPPVTQFRLGAEDRGFCVEFLTPLRGSGYTRTGKPDATMARAGVTAQKLRHIDLLLAFPWTVILDAKAGFPVAKPRRVLIANPVSFIAQKLLISEERSPRKRAQDILYIHDTLDLFGSELALLRTLWRGRVRGSVQPRAAARVEAASREQFAAVNDIIRESARIPQDRALTPERIQMACEHGLEQLFARP